MKAEGIMSLILLVLAIVSDIYFSGSRQIKPKYMFRIINYAPTVIMFASNNFKFSLYPTWPFKHPIIFILSLIGIACIPSLIGFFEGLFLGLKNNKWSIKPWETVERIAKYGIRPDFSDGRFEITSKHIGYTMSSNILGASCSIGLFLFVQTMPNFLTFIADKDWTKYFETLLGLAMIIALFFNSVQQNRQLPKINYLKDENPNNYLKDENPNNFLLNRVHAILNTVHLTVTLYFCLINIFYILVYPIICWKSGNRLELNPLIFFPIIVAVFFLLFGNALSSAQRFIPEAYGNFVTGTIVLVVFVIVWSFSLFNISLTHLFIVILSIVIISLYFKFKKVSNKKILLSRNYRNILLFIPPLILLVELLIAFVYIILKRN